MFHVEHFPKMFHEEDDADDQVESGRVASGEVASWQDVEEGKRETKNQRRSALGVHLPLRLFASLHRIASRNLFIPGRMEGPSPSFGDRPANHAMESPGHPNRAQVDVDDDCPDY